MTNHWLITHGHTVGSKPSRLYRLWKNMLRRCRNPNRPDFKYYGGRGIFVREEWQHFEPFMQWSMSHGYAPGKQIDRKEQNGPYSPENCRWTTSKGNNRNKRSNRLITALGETKCLIEWPEDPRCRVAYTTLHSRLGKLEWPAEAAITTPVMKRGHRFSHH
jgi:hypothetical protein